MGMNGNIGNYSENPVDSLERRMIGLEAALSSSITGPKEYGPLAAEYQKLKNQLREICNIYGPDC